MDEPYVIALKPKNAKNVDFATEFRELGFNDVDFLDPIIKLSSSDFVILPNNGIGIILPQSPDTIIYLEEDEYSILVSP